MPDTDRNIYTDPSVQNLPNSIEAEQAVLGAIIIDQNVMTDVVSDLKPEYFYSRINQDIYREMVAMFTEHRPIDFVTVLDAVMAARIFDSQADAKNYLFGITQTVPTIKNIGSYARIIVDKYTMRALIEASREIIVKASDEEENGEKLLEYSEQKIYDIRQGRDSSQLTHIKTAILDSLDHLQKLNGADREKYMGLKTGYSMLDRIITGLNKSDLIILAARPGVGKSSLALNIAVNVAKAYPVSVVYFSLEMTNRQLVERALSFESGVNSQAMRLGEMTRDDWHRISEGSDSLSRTNIYFDDTSGISVQEIKAKCMRTRNLGLVIVDYLQLMGGSGRYENRTLEISEITRAFKLMAKELNVPVMLLSQLSRAVEKDSGKRKPRLSDLRDSGSIEQDADIVMFLHRDDSSDDAGAPGQPNESEVSLIISKNRHGETDELTLHWDGAHTRFTSVDYAREY
ncbi:MAG: replicative DNA helicase [Oscillospiraceae bacterium]|jgi:replicative DNA helicase